MTRPQSITATIFRRKPVRGAGAPGEATDDPHLKRSIGTFQLTLFGVGATVGTGIFIVVPEAISKAGPAVLIAFVVAGVAAGLAEYPGKRQVVFRIEVASGAPARNVPVITPAVPERVLTGQQRDPRRRALGHRVCVGKSHAPTGQRVNLGCLQLQAAVTTDPLGPQVINHDEQDIRPLCGVEKWQQEQPQGERNNAVHVKWCTNQLTATRIICKEVNLRVPVPGRIRWPPLHTIATWPARSR